MPETVSTERPRTGDSPEWEVFVREGPDDPLSHAGSVSAPTADAARDRAATLFGWAAAATWLCPADAVVRTSARDLGARYRDGEGDAGDRNDEGGDEEDGNDEGGDEEDGNDEGGADDAADPEVTDP